MSTEAQPEHDEGGVDICRSHASIEELQSDPSDMVYEPRAEEKPGRRVEIRAQRENPDIVAWGFWGGILAAVVAGFVLLRAGTTTLGVTDTLVVMMLLMLGLGLYKLGPKSTLEDELLCELDLNDKILSWPATKEGNIIAVAFDDVEKITFALTKIPVKKSRAGTHLEAATVRILDDRGRDIPVVTASTSKGEAHRVARIIAKVTGLSVDYVGTGVGEWAQGTAVPW